MLKGRSPPEKDDDPMNNDILKAVVKLGNTVLSNKAAADLNRFVHELYSSILRPKSC